MSAPDACRALVTLAEIAAQLNAAGYRTARGARFGAKQVQRITQRRQVYAGLTATTPSVALNASVTPKHQAIP